MTLLFWPLTAALIACRFYHFRPYLDHPHLFRQADTAFYSLGFYRFGLNIFLPTVGWLGNGGHVILEFPLTEWIAATLYFLTGPTILVDRLVNVGFFLGSVFFLFKIVDLVHDRLLARIVAVLYLSVPLGIYYSRAVHIDFTAVCFSHALLYYALRFVVTTRGGDLALATVAGVMAFVIKAPYGFYLLLPVLVYGRQRRAAPWRWGGAVAPFVVGAVAFAGWFAYSQWVNRQAPDLSFIPSYADHVNRFSWYFGTLEQRWTLAPWRTVAGRVFREIGATAWWLLVPFGWLAFRRLRSYYGFTLSWSAGTVVYVLLFLNLNEMHNYYQIPFMAPFCLWLAAPIYACWTADRSRAPWGPKVAAALLVAYAATSMLVATQRFYRTDPVHRAIGEFVRAQTSESDLIVMAYTEAAHGDPSFLFYARRYGWSVGHRELSPAVVEGLRHYGASIVVSSSMWPPDEATRTYLAHNPLTGVLRVDGGEVMVHRLATRHRSH
jgi:hypothetical protein